VLGAPGNGQIKRMDRRKNPLKKNAMVITFIIENRESFQDERPIVWPQPVTGLKPLGFLDWKTSASNGGCAPARPAAHVQ
jgi:hypothetical protein